MATIERYQIGSGAMYRVRYRTPDNRSTQKRGFKTKRDAELFAATVEVSKARGEYVPASVGKVTVGELGPGVAGSSTWPSEGVDPSVLRIELGYARCAALGWCPHLRRPLLRGAGLGFGHVGAARPPGGADRVFGAGVGTR
jgi:hypothetical protein